MIIIGTSGYSFRDWAGSFYPPGIPQGKMLDFYARKFQAVEINSTYYRLPHPKVMVQIERKTPEGFRFLVKFHGDVTHRTTRDRAAFAAFDQVLQPLEDAGKFCGALAQFPWSFRAGEANRDYLRFLRETFGPRPLFVEFRHDSWAREETYAFLRELEIGFCCVDEPRLRGLFPPVIQATTGTGYVRMHGRNARDWWGGDSSGRYNYLYNEAELREWAGLILELAGKTKDTFVFFNNCHAGRAAENARQMEALLQLG